MFCVAGQAACSHHSPETLLLHEKSGLVGQGMADPMALVSRMHHDVGTVERRPFGVVIQKRTASGENVPRVINVKIHHAQPKGKVDAGHGIPIAVDGSELALREDLSMIV